MKKTIGLSEFRSAFMDWETYKDNFSWEGLEALYNHITDMEEGMDDEIELDVVAFCVEYTEYASAMEAAQAYDYEEGVDLEPHGSVDLLEVAELEEKQALEWLNDRTSVIEVGNGKVIIQDF